MRSAVKTINAFGTALLLAVACGRGNLFAQAALEMQPCEHSPQPAFCSAVRGVRAEGWPAQSRSEVMAQHGMVVTSQPLAAQAGLQILQQGGNAIDAAVATAAVLNVMEPMMVGVGGDLFAVIYIAKERKIYVLNCQRHGAHGRNARALQQAGLSLGSEELGAEVPGCRSTGFCR